MPPAGFHLSIPREGSEGQRGVFRVPDGDRRPMSRPSSQPKTLDKKEYGHGQSRSPIGRRYRTILSGTVLWYVGFHRQGDKNTMK